MNVPGGKASISESGAYTSATRDERCSNFLARIALKARNS
jgi:hypothetical protein